MDQLFKLTHENSVSVRLYGYDIQPQQNTFMAGLNKWLPPETEVYKSLWQLNGMYGFAYQSEADSFRLAREEFKRKATDALTFIENNTSVSGQKKEIYLEGIKGLIKKFGSIEMNQISKYPDNINYRDSLMYEQVAAIIEANPNDKFIILGQNYHLKKGRYRPENASDVKWMGHYLAEKYKDNYYSIGMAVKQGKDYNHVEDTVYSFKSEGDGYLVNNITFKNGCNLLLTETQKHHDFAADKYYKIKGIQGYDGLMAPKQDFDAILFIKEGKPVSVRD